MSHARRAPVGNRPAAGRSAIAAVLLVGVALVGCSPSGGGGSRDPAPPQPAPLTSSDGDAISASFSPVLAAGGAAGEAAFDQYVYPILTDYCTNCHAGAGPGFPHISHPDVGTAFRAVVDNQKVNLMIPANSRLVQRLVTDGHFCWSDCAANGIVMEAAITNWADAVLAVDPNAPAPGDPIAGFISSDVRGLGNARKVESTRYDRNVIALWKFEEGSGETAFDTSGLMPAIDLDLRNAEWLSGGGIALDGGRALGTVETSRKLYNRIASGSGSQQYTIEAWVFPATTMQGGPARIVTYSDGTDLRNFTMGQSQYNYVFRNRSLAPGVDQNGTPALETAEADQDLQSTLQHAVMTFDQVNGRRIYVNGEDTGDRDPEGPGLLVNWSPDFRVSLGAETSNNRRWAGQLRLVAVHDRALTPAQIMQNFRAGAAQKFVLRFGLDATLGTGAFIEFEVSEFDSYSYLFCFPRLDTAGLNGVAVEGIRIAVNGVAPVQSQSFRSIATTVSGSAQLSRLCGVVPKDLGAQLDGFAIFFEVLGGLENLLVEDPPPPPPNNDVADPLPDVGIRSFAQVNDTLASVTGVDATTASVQATYDELTEQLPGSSDVRSFVSAQQVAISKLALEYCDALVESPGLREAFFGTQFQFDAPVTTSFATQVEKDLIIDPLIDRMVMGDLLTLPTSAEVRPLMNGLIDDLTATCAAASCDATRTRTVVKAACAAVMSSAALQLQ